MSVVLNRALSGDLGPVEDALHPDKVGRRTVNVLLIAPAESKEDTAGVAVLVRHMRVLRESGARVRVVLQGTWSSGQNTKAPVARANARAFAAAADEFVVVASGHNVRATGSVVRKLVPCNAHNIVYTLVKNTIGRAPPLPGTVHLPGEKAEAGGIDGANFSSGDSLYRAVLGYRGSKGLRGIEPRPEFLESAEKYMRQAEGVCPSGWEAPDGVAAKKRAELRQTRESQVLGHARLLSGLHTMFGTGHTALLSSDPRLVSCDDGSSPFHHIFAKATGIPDKFPDLPLMSLYDLTAVLCVRAPEMFVPADKGLGGGFPAVSFNDAPSESVVAALSAPQTGVWLVIGDPGPHDADDLAVVENLVRTASPGSVLAFLSVGRTRHCATSAEERVRQVSVLLDAVGKTM